MGADQSDQNKAVALRFILEAVAGNDPVAWNETMAADLVDHNPMPDQPAGRAGQQYGVDTLRVAFPDMRATVDQQLAEGDLVTQRGTVSGTNTGEFMGMPPTNQTATLNWIDVYRFDAGRITEIWHVEDLLGLARQLGHTSLPASEQKGAH